MAVNGTRRATCVQLQPFENEGDTKVMINRTSARLAVSIAALLAAGTSLPNTLSHAQTQRPAQGASRHVIVILRDQLPALPGEHGGHGSRAAALASAQSGVLDHLRQAGATNVRSFHLVNAVAATVTKAEADALASHPQVSAVVEDRVIRQVRRSSDTVRAGGGAGLNSTSVATTSASADNGLCNTLEPQALQLTNTAFSNSGVPQAQQILDGKGVPVTGRGVKVAYVADGLDPTLPGFIRPDGSSVFIDYQDFSGDPAGTPTAGGEAFGDASSIAAQDMPNGKPLLFDISQFVNPAHPLPSPCNIRIRGMAPGASLVGLKIFSNLGYTTTSSFVQAIEYAVLQDDVDVINESFGGNPFPDLADDPISLANEAAVAAGVTVVVSTGDAGTNGTLGSPSTESSVIAAGASTQFRFYAQTNYGAQPLATGYLNNNISSFSSGGFSQTGARTVDVVAPGDLSWALCSTNSTLYQDCSNFQDTNTNTPIESFGGTSEAAPLTAGEAALVIQAYRSTHGGYNPTPALVKQIIKSTATDLGAPSSEQGAGLINSYAAVHAALSVHDGNGRPGYRGESVLASPTSAAVIGGPRGPQRQSFTITNTGGSARHLTPALQTLGAPIAGRTLTLNLDPSTAPTYVNVTGAPRSYIEQKFTVPHGAQHLDAAIAWVNPLSTNQIVYLSLLDPSGRNAAYSIPQGADSGYGHVDVVAPAAGTWTAIISTRPTGVADSYSGPVQFAWSAENFVDIGTVYPSSLDLAPGASETITASWNLPAQPGDSAAAIRFGNAGIAEIPVTQRTMIPTGSTGGTFTGTITGGNGRPSAGPTQTFAFNVPAGVNNLSLHLEIPDNGYLLEGLLVAPDGMQLSVQGNLDPSGNPQYGMDLYRANPAPGRWRFILLENFTASGNEIAVPFSARIAFNSARITASLPDDPGVTLSLSAAPVAVPVTVVNTGAVTQAYFADARLSGLSSEPLPVYGCSQNTTLPGFCSAFYLPPEIDSVQFIAQSSAPISMDAYNDTGYNVGGTGSPDIFAYDVSSGPYTIVASLSRPEIPYGLWIESPALVGPYGAAGAQTAPISTGAFALMQPFDTAVSSDSGDVWADLTVGSQTYNPLVLAPGESGTINLLIAPNAPAGTVVSGYLYIDTFNPNLYTGDEVVSIPYTYTVGK
jgi:hypothetical protein